jgi:hypothetical protein
VLDALNAQRVMPSVRLLRGAGTVDMASPETYRDVFDRLERDGVRYIVLSGVTVVLHGHARMVADLDMVALQRLF